MAVSQYYLRNDLTVHYILRDKHTHHYFIWHLYLQELLRHGYKLRLIR